MPPVSGTVVSAGPVSTAGTGQLTMSSVQTGPPVSGVAFVTPGSSLRATMATSEGIEAMAPEPAVGRAGESITAPYECSVGRLPSPRCHRSSSPSTTFVIPGVCARAASRMRSSAKVRPGIPRTRSCRTTMREMPLASMSRGTAVRSPESSAVSMPRVMAANPATSPK